MKVLSIFGTRPEAIKFAAVIKALECRESFSSVVCVTAQHREMLDQVLSIFSIRPDYDLNIMRSNQTLHDITANAIQSLRSVMEEARPDIVLVQGDTTTTFAGALAAYYSKIPVAHIEAGLRTYDKYRPFPEEVNRRLTTQIADFHFAPTSTSRDNLLREGIASEKIFVTGNTVIDALKMIVERQSQPKEKRRLNTFFKEFGVDLSAGKRMILITGHRRENFGGGFEDICLSIRRLAERFSDTDFVYPVHLNPNVQEPVRRILSGIENIHLIMPMDYEPFVYLMSQSHIILTDSGGVQEEAPFLGKPVLVMRETTERPEGVEAGTVKLMGTDKEKIFIEASTLIEDETAYAVMSKAHNPYGDGMSAPRILSVLEKFQKSLLREIK